MRLILIAIYIVILLIEVPGLLKKRLYPELMVFMALFLIGLYMGLAYSFQWPLGAPFEALAIYAEPK